MHVGGEGCVAPKQGQDIEVPDPLAARGGVGD